MTTVSVVVPVYGNAGTLVELHDRVVAALGDRLVEVVYVDDASPDDSSAVLAGIAGCDERAVVMEKTRNGGQQRALLDGLARARGEWRVCMDADLQDPPEAIPAMLAGAGGSNGARPRDSADAAGGAGIVFGGRHGRYAPVARRATSRAFKAAQAAIAGLPPDAGTFVAIRADVAERVLALDDDARPPFLPGMLAATGARWVSVPVERAPSDASAYDARARLDAGLRGLRWAVAARRARRAGAHLQTQRDYYERRVSTSIQPRPTPYTARQVAAAVGFAALAPGERVLDAGCGLGRATLLLRRHGVDVEGLDLSPVLLEQLARTPGGEGLALHAGDLAQPPVHLHERFDAVAGFFVLHHMHDLDAAVRGVARMVRPGGRVVFVEPNAACPLFYLQIAGTPGMTFAADGGIVRMRPGRLRAALEGAGLGEVRTETFGLVPPALANRPRGRALERRLEPPLAPVRAFRLVAARKAR